MVNALQSAHPIRVMVVDDSTIGRAVLTRYLKFFENVDVVGEASDGQMAVKCASDLIPDAIIMDINMPVLGGIEATTLIHQRYPHIKVIGLTGFDSPEDIQHMLDSGATACFSKTSGLIPLVEAIMNAVLGINS